MTLNDETAASIAREVVDGGKATRVYPHSTDVALVRAGYAYRDAEVEELRARLARVRAVYDAWLPREAEMWVDLLLSDILDALDESPTERETHPDEVRYRAELEEAFQSRDWATVEHLLTNPDAPPVGTPKERECTCPSGGGSLRWPCPTHPPATREMVTEKTVERAARAYWRKSMEDVGMEPDDWDESERERYMWAARIVLEAALTEKRDES